MRVYTHPRSAHPIAPTPSPASFPRVFDDGRGISFAIENSYTILMSQKTAQLVIGRLLTDEELRAQFLGRPFETLAAFRDLGFDLTEREIDALLETDKSLWTDAAGRIDPRLQRCSFRTK